MTDNSLCSGVEQRVNFLPDGLNFALLMPVYLLVALVGSVVMCIINFFIHIDKAMRTNIVIDDQLMEEVLKTTGLKTKRQAVEQGLKLLLRMKQQEKIKRYRGKLEWQGDLDEMRKD